MKSHLSWLPNQSWCYIESLQVWYMLDAVLCATNLCVHRQKLREAVWERGRQSESPLVPGACHKLPKLLLHPLIHSVTGCLPLLLWLLYNCLSLCLCVLLSLCLSVLRSVPLSVRFPVAWACPRSQRGQNVRLSCRHFLFQFFFLLSSTSSFSLSLRFSWWFPWPVCVWVCRTCSWHQNK